MNFIKTEIEGAYLIERTPSVYQRGYFARLYCANEFRDAGITITFPQMNLCQNKEKGVLRGLHYQTGGKEEDKVVACTRGKIFDVCVDIRPDSKTFCKYIAYELSEENGRMLFIPKGCAHGYMTLEKNCQLLYLMSEFYVPGLAAGYRYDDPVFNICWPDMEKIIISEKDETLPFINKIK